ncbi:MAG: chromosomal replication initiator protein DnaA [Rickettsiales bacterium]|nr:chromosomal replication initiator protein DnaA [Rickettsiales bacterium]
MMLNLAICEKEDGLKTTFLNDFLNACNQFLGEEITAKWLAELSIFSHSTNEIIFAAQSKFVRDWIIREFIENKKLAYNLQKIATTIDPQIKKVSIIAINKEAVLTTIAPTQNAQIINLSKHDNVFAFGSELNPKYTFANFVSGKYNKLAVAMARIAAGSKGTQTNMFDSAIPLFIHGGIGMGKTHLAQAIAWQIKDENKSKKVVYLSAEKFMYHFVQSVRSNATMDFKQRFRSIDVLIIDDVQFIAGKTGTQEEFMHTFNSLVENGKQVVLVCDRSPSDLEAIDEKLKSRISGGMVLNFKNPDFADRLEILQKKTALSGEEIDEKILELLASKINSSVRDLDGALRKLLANKFLANEEITLDGARLIAAEYSKTSAAAGISIEKIQKAVAAHYEIKVANLLANTRSRAIARPRQIAMYLAKSLTAASLPQIGRELGNKNHATVIYAIKSVQKNIEKDVVFAREIKGLEDAIR